MRNSCEASDTKRVMRSWATTWTEKAFSFCWSIMFSARWSEPTSVLEGSVTGTRADRSPPAIRPATPSIWRRERKERCTR